MKLSSAGYNGLDMMGWALWADKGLGGAVATVPPEWPDKIALLRSWSCFAFGPYHYFMRGNRLQALSGDKSVEGGF